MFDVWGMFLVYLILIFAIEFVFEAFGTILIITKRYYVGKG